jgi:hypothetical protein
MMIALEHRLFDVTNTLNKMHIRTVVVNSEDSFVMLLLYRETGNNYVKGFRETGSILRSKGKPERYMVRKNETKHTKLDILKSRGSHLHGKWVWLRCQYEMQQNLIT